MAKASTIDPAILRLLKIPHTTPNISISPVSGASMSSAQAFKISLPHSETSGRPAAYFLKTGRGVKAATMFEGEHASLNAIHSAVPSLCPMSYGWGRLEGDNARSGSAGEGDAFLVTDFLDLRATRGARNTNDGGRVRKLSLAAKLGKLHTTPAPSVDGQSKFGFPVPTCCGDTPQENGFKSSWAEFFGENRLLFILGRSEKANGKDAELSKLVHETVDTVVPRLIGDARLNGGKGVAPVVVHGDLWSGNKGHGIIGGEGEAEDVVYDSSACYAHSEYDLGIMNMFGGFSKSFWNEYHALVPKTDPADEYEDRIKLYELYHHLNHHALFGGGYRGGAMSIMKQLIAKYGGD